MPSIITRLRKTIVLTATAFMLLLFPFSATTFADTCTPPPNDQNGVHWPTGSDAGTFTYQCDGQYQGMWTNAHYIYDPATGSRTPIDPLVYTYNQSTGLWDTSQWDYSVPQGGYVLDTVSVATPPAGAQTIGGPAPVAPPANSSSNLGTSSGSGQASPQTTTSGQPGGTGVSLNGSNSTGISNATGANMSNGVTSMAGSGNANVIGNTLGGSAATGSATSVASIINMLQSTSNILGDPNMMTFTANINGDVNGDLLLDPAQLGTIQPANTSANLGNEITVNNSTDTSINNTIAVGATSGNANLSENTVAGDATSGNANAVANIVNVLNSAVRAGQSFVGVININGNLNGDILLPPNFIDTLLASNVPHYTIDTSTLNTTDVTNTNNQSINNNVTASATSGNATAIGNTSGGNATSGSAKANLTVFNLTGSTVVASNDIMVFVNVLGSWYGMILNAPAGATAASLGGGVTTNANATNDASLTNTNNQSINNNITVNSKSGNATATNNTKAGNAKSGDATSSVILANMINDSLSLNGWFGLLFINVFGTWTGSFGINTSAGDPVISAPVAAGASGSAGSSGSSQMFQFIPKASTFSNKVYLSNGTTANTSGDASTAALSKASVLAAQTVKTPTSNLPELAQNSQSYLLPILGVGLAIIILLAGERNRFFHRS